MKKTKLLLSSLLGWLLMSCGMGQETGRNSKSGIEVLPVAEFKSRLEADTSALLLDVRRPEEYADGHLHGAVSLDWLDPATFKKGAADIDNRHTVYVYCRSGRRSNEAANHLSARGYKVIDMQGGIMAWREAGYPTE